MQKVCSTMKEAAISSGLSVYAYRRFLEAWVKYKNAGGHFSLVIGVGRNKRYPVFDETGEVVEENPNERIL